MATCIQEERGGLPYLCCTDEETGETTCKLHKPDPRSPALTCYSQSINGDEQECCAPLDGSAPESCGRLDWRALGCLTPGDPRCAPVPGPGAWDHARRGTLGLELSASSFAGVHVREANADRDRTYPMMVGLEASLRVLYRWEPDLDDIPGLFAALAQVFTGNDLGLELRGGAFVAKGGTTGTYAVLRPATLLSHGRYRFFGLLQAAPELGLIKVGDAPAELHWGLHMPIGVALTRDLGLEATFNASPTLGYSLGLGLFVR